MNSTTTTTIDFNGLKFYRYMRLSSATALKRGDLQTQDYQTTKRAKYLGIIIVETFIDGAVSGIDFKRLTERKRMLNQLKTNTDISGILIESLDRLGRSAVDLSNIIESVTNEQKKIIIDMISQFETRTPEGFLRTQMMVIFADYQRRWMKQKLEWGRERALAKGIKFGRKQMNIPAKELLEAKRMYASGIGLTSIAKYLNCSPSTARRRLIALGVIMRPIHLKTVKKKVKDLLKKSNNNKQT